MTGRRIHELPDANPIQGDEMLVLDQGGVTKRSTPAEILTEFINVQVAFAVPSVEWTYSHGLGTYPSVGCLDSTGRYVEGDVIYPDENTVTVNWDSLVSGTMILN